MKYLILILLMATTFPCHAQYCGAGYERNERGKILSIYPQIEKYINEMAKIAEVTANTSSLTLSNISRLDRRFQSIKSQLRNFSKRYRPRLSDLGNTFIAEESFPAYIANLTVGGSSNLESQSNSRDALDNFNFALFSIGNCFYTSWIKHPINGTSNDGQCAGGYDLEDKQVVLRKATIARKVLINMAYIAEEGANNYLPISERIRDDADYQFFKEEIDKVGLSPIRNITDKTKNFIRTFLDPIFLGINDTTVNGSTMMIDPIAMENSRKALDALNFALYELTRCTE